LRTTIIICCLLVSVPVWPAQRDPGRQEKVLTPEQKVYQQALKQASAERQRLRAQAKQAFDAEMAQEKAEDCPNARTTYEINVCLSKESGITDGNYKSYAEAVRALLSLKEPPLPGQQAEPVHAGTMGPELTPEQQAAEFDGLEATWKPYSEAVCTATFHQFGGGTAGPAAEGECRLRMTRQHMRDLDQVYFGLLHL
jgi:hypothetical protein